MKVSREIYRLPLPLVLMTLPFIICLALGIILLLIVAIIIFAQEPKISNAPQSAAMAIYARTVLLVVCAGLLILYCSSKLAYVIYLNVSRWGYWPLFPFLIAFIMPYHIFLLSWKSLWAESGLVLSLLSGVPLLEQVARIISSQMLYAAPGVLAVWVLRFSGISIVLAFLRLLQLPSSTVHAAMNHGMSPQFIYRRIIFPWMVPILALTFVFLFLSLSLDAEAPAFVGGQKIFLLGSFLQDLHRSQGGHRFAAALGAIYILVILGFSLSLLSLLTARRIAVTISAPIGVKVKRPPSPKAGIILFCMYIALYVGLMSTACLRSLGWEPVQSHHQSGQFAFSAVSYSQVFASSDWRESLLISAGISATSGVIALALSFITGLWIRNSRSMPTIGASIGRRFYISLIIFPLVLPPLIIAAIIIAGALLTKGYQGSVHTVLWVHVLMFSPAAYFVIESGFDSLPFNLVAVARNHRVAVHKLFLLTVRHLVPHSAVAVAVVFSLSINESVVARMLSGFAKPVSVKIADASLSGIGSEHFAIGNVLTCLAIGIVLVSLLGLRVRSRKNQARLVGVFGEI